MVLNSPDAARRQTLIPHATYFYLFGKFPRLQFPNIIYIDQYIIIAVFDAFRGNSSDPNSTYTYFHSLGLQFPMPCISILWEISQTPIPHIIDILVYYYSSMLCFHGKFPRPMAMEIDVDYRE